MNKRILLPTDFSQYAFNAIRYALNLYDSVDCDFYFLNVYQVDGYALDNMMMVPEPGERAFEVAKRKSEEQFEKLMEQLRAHPKNPRHRYHTISTFNSLLEAVKQTIAKKDIDIVVMGTKGLTQSRTVIYGTNAINVMEKVTECPVLAVPLETQFVPPKEIVFPTDFKTVFKRKELNYLIEICKMHNSFLWILHIDRTDGLSKRQLENKDLLDSILGDIDHDYNILEDMKVQEGINIFVESRGSDMIAFINRKHHFFGSIFTKPLVKELGYHSRIPILVLNDRS
ncbi:universal stress protein [Flagellimonas lutaonensis]|uniref:Universal stress protein n=1 Tax=Flagellimonas lutaonensis TaxID=516051 RepID=A0A0D5YPT3_9FLAO|nr:universal stress protein [Allomuricauda lutaonensis]AKA34237.1 Universal stress protein [Allomuricauda lutaonensis]